MKPTITVDLCPTATVTSLITDEQVLGSVLTVELDNSDNSLDGVAYEGKPISVSLSPGGGIPKGWVLKQEYDSYAGKKLLRLTVVDAWYYLRQSIPALDIQLWNNELMLDPDTGDVKTRFSDYWQKNIQHILSAILSGAIEATLSNGAAIPGIMPTLTVTNAAKAVRELLEYCPGLLRVDGNTFTYVVPSETPSYTYRASAGETLVTVYSKAVTIPNRIFVESLKKNATTFGVEDPICHTSDPAQDDNSHHALGYWIDRHIQLFQELTKAKCNEYANNLLVKLQKEAAQGEIITHHTHSQRLLDTVKGIDARGEDVTGVITRIQRKYDRGTYQVTFRLGGASTSASPPDDSPAPATESIPASALPPIQQDWQYILPRAIQGYQHDIHFVAYDWNTVSWEAGTIKFYDGDTQSINAGNTGNLATAAIYYIYFDLDDVSPNVLKVTNNYLNVMTMKTGVLCTIQRGSSTDQMALVLPSYGKEPLITPDFIYMTGLLKYDYGGEKYLQKLLSTSVSAGRIVLSETTGSLDDISDGSYAKVKGTDIQAGHIKLTSHVEALGEWYDKAGVEIDAEHGINIYGKDEALTTRASKYGTIQCKVDSSGQITAGGGNIIINADGLESKHTTSLRFSYGGSCIAHIYASSGGHLYLQPYNYVWLTGDARTRNVAPYGTGFNLGYPELPWNSIVCNTIFRKNEYDWQHLDDVALIRQMKEDPRNPGFVDLASVPEIILDTPPSLAAEHEDQIRMLEKEIPKMNAEHRQPVLNEINRLKNEAKEMRTKEPVKMINAYKEISLALGAIRQLADRIDRLEARHGKA